MEEVLHGHAWERMHGTNQPLLWLLSGSSGRIHRGNLWELLHAKRWTAFV